ncbi:MAG: DUF1624 domain-containing protein [Bacteroidetes bacterium]|nr:DUF1624 domain-containing protein [Bacteroidota bacterium]
MSTNLSGTPKYRVWSIDLLRGIIMVIMAIDHVRDFFHIQASTGDPTDMATTTPQLFFTRWITHFCAPTFVFLAGTAAYLNGTKKTKVELSSFLMKRGLWLILVEIMVMSLAFTFDPLYHIFIFQVIWATGISMFLLGLMVRLPFAAILSIGLLILIGHNSLDRLEAANGNSIGFWWDLLHHGHFAFYPLFGNHQLMIFYPFLPWFGVICCGYCFGKLYGKTMLADKRRKILIGLGSALIALFIILRFINNYGDPAPWSVQRNPLYSFLSFLNTTKYPPSLMYLCMTLGPSILSLAFLERVQNKVTDFFTVFGRVPFFYYITHFFFIHFLCVIAFFISGYGIKDIHPKRTPFLFRPDDFGVNLPAMYAIWVFVIICLYPLCKWYNKYKSTHYQWWLSYL